MVAADREFTRSAREANLGFFRQYDQPFRYFLDLLLSNYSAPRVLDIGAGSGRVAVDLACRCPEVRVDVLEVSGKVVSKIRRVFSLLGIVADGRALPIQSDSYAGVLLFEVLETVPEKDLERMIAEAVRVTSPRAFLLVGSFGQRYILQFLEDLNLQHEVAFVRSAISQPKIIRTFCRFGCRLLHLFSMTVGGDEGSRNVFIFQKVQVPYVR